MCVMHNPAGCSVRIRATELPTVPNPRMATSRVVPEARRVVREASLPGTVVVRGAMSCVVFTVPRSSLKGQRRPLFSQLLFSSRQLADGLSLQQAHRACFLFFYRSHWSSGASRSESAFLQLREKSAHASGEPLWAHPFRSPQS